MVNVARFVALSLHKRQAKSRTPTNCKRKNHRMEDFKPNTADDASLSSAPSTPTMRKRESPEQMLEAPSMGDPKWSSEEEEARERKRLKKLARKLAKRSAESDASPPPAKKARLEEEETKKKQKREDDDDDSEASPAKKARVAGLPIDSSDASEASEEEEDDDEDALEAPRKLGGDEVKKAKKKSGGRKPALLKKDLEHLVRTSDSEGLKQRGLNSRKEPRHVISNSKHDVSLPEGRGKLKGLTTLSLAIYYVFLAASRDDLERTTEALETLRVLVDECGIDATSIEPRAQLLAFISTGAERSAGGTFKDRSAHVQVLKTLMESANGFLNGRKAVMSAVGRFIEDGRTPLLSALLKKRASVLDDAHTFEVATMVMVDGTDAMLRSTLSVLKKGGKLTPELCHAVTGSTLLHFAAKREQGRHVELVLPYSDAKLTDNKGRTALHFLEKFGAPTERLALLRAA